MGGCSELLLAFFDFELLMLYDVQRGQSSSYEQLAIDEHDNDEEQSLAHLRSDPLTDDQSLPFSGAQRLKIDWLSVNIGSACLLEA